jgi:predicted small lipoprotein YifL
LVAAGPLVGCGQKGPLYLPKPLPAPPEAEKRSGKDAGDAQKPVDAGSDPQRQPSDRK